MTEKSVYNMDGKFLLNGVERPTTPIDPTNNAVEYIKNLTSKRDFVDITLEDDGRLGVRTDEDNILIGHLSDVVYDIYGDVLLQVIESGVTPRIQASSEMVGDSPSIWLHFRQNHEELVWEKFKRRPTPEQLAMKAEHDSMMKRHKERMHELNSDGRRTQVLMEYESGRKKGLVTWLLWLLLGSFGAHRYYLGDTKQGIFMSIAGLCMWFPGLLWCLIDGLKINGRIKSANFAFWQRIASMNDVPVDPLPESASN